MYTYPLFPKPMITIQQDQLNQHIKRITTASVDDYAQLIRNAVNAVGIAIAFCLAIASTARSAYRHPLAALDQWTKSPVAVAAPVKAPPTKKTPSPRPTAPAVSVISEKPATASTPKRTPRARKRKTLATA
jgi:hypothetical protein